MDNLFAEALRAGLANKRVTFINVGVFFNADERRELDDITFPGPLPFLVIQTKRLSFSADSVKEGKPVGNHWHSKESGRIEFFVAVGGEGDLFRFAWKESGSGEVKETIMKCGEACLIPVGASHAFVPLQDGCQIWGWSNKKHEQKNDKPDVIIPVPK